MQKNEEGVSVSAACGRKYLRPHPLPVTPFCGVFYQDVISIAVVKGAHYLEFLQYQSTCSDMDVCCSVQYSEISLIL